MDGSMARQLMDHVEGLENDLENVAMVLEMAYENTQMNCSDTRYDGAVMTVVSKSIRQISAVYTERLNDCIRQICEEAGIKIENGQGESN